MESFLNQHLRPKLDLRNSEKRASLTEENHGARSPPGCPHLRQLTDPPPPGIQNQWVSSLSLFQAKFIIIVVGRVTGDSVLSWEKKSQHKLLPLPPGAHRLAQPCCPSQPWRDPGVHAASVDSPALVHIARSRHSPAPVCLWVPPAKPHS